MGKWQRAQRQRQVAFWTSYFFNKIPWTCLGVAWWKSISVPLWTLWSFYGQTMWGNSLNIKHMPLFLRSELGGNLRFPLILPHPASRGVVSIQRLFKRLLGPRHPHHPTFIFTFNICFSYFYGPWLLFPLLPQHTHHNTSKPGSDFKRWLHFSQTLHSSST